MTHEEAFLQDIVENQDDDAPRRIFADWLLDRGDPASQARAEFIHLQCDLARHPCGTPRPEPLLRRQRELLWNYGSQWSGLQRFGCVCWEYRRGFVEGVGMPLTAFVAHAASLFQVAPVRSLKLYDAAGQLTTLAGSPHLSRLHSLDLEKNNLGDHDLADLARSPHLGQVGTLLLWNNRIGDGGVRSLVQAELSGLSRLDLSNNIVGDAGAAALAASSLLGQLRTLDLTGNHIGDSGGSALALSTQTANLTWLDLTKNPIDASQAVLRERLGSRVQVLN